jgi:hypothetical protein
MMRSRLADQHDSLVVKPKNCASCYPADQGSVSVRQGKPCSDRIPITGGPLKLKSDPRIGLSLSVPQENWPIAHSHKHDIAVAIVIEIPDRQPSS